MSLASISPFSDFSDLLSVGSASLCGSLRFSGSFSASEASFSIVELSFWSSPSGLNSVVKRLLQIK